MTILQTNLSDPMTRQQATVLGQPVLTSLSDCRIVRQVLRFRTIGSTNSLARDLARLGEPGGLVILADEQTAGRGRLGRSFVSPEAGGLWFSILLRPSTGKAVTPAATLVAGTAVAETLCEAGVTKARVKWPNDILIDERKTAGILAESGTDSKGDPWLVLGIGVNLGLTEFSPELEAIATSVMLSAGIKIDPIDLLTRLLRRLDSLMDLHDREGFEAVRSRYLAVSATVGREVVLIDTHPSSSDGNGDPHANGPVYRCIDIAADGSLVLEDGKGRLFHQNHGEISLRHRRSQEGNHP